MRFSQAQKKSSTPASSREGAPALRAQLARQGDGVDCLAGLISSGGRQGVFTGAAVLRATSGGKDDPFEKEADSVASRVAGPSSGAPLRISRIGVGAVAGVSVKGALFKEKDDEKEKNHAQRLFLNGKDGEDKDEERLKKLSLAKKSKEEEEKDKDKKKAQTKTAHSGALPLYGAGAAEAALKNKGAGEPLRPDVRRRLESRMGADLSGVRVHTGASAEAANAELRARAFTHGEHIWLGAGESSSDLKLMAHEAAHVVQQGAAMQAVGHQQAASPGAPGRVQRSLFDDIAGGLGAAWDATGGRLVDAAGKAIALGAEFFWKVFESLAPALVPFLREIIDSGGILNFLYNKVKGVVGKIFGGLSSRSETLAHIFAVFSDLLASAGEILSALASGDCKPLFDAVDRLKNTVSDMAGKAWDSVTNFFKPIGDFFSNVWQTIGAPAIDWIKDVAGDVWNFIKDIGARIWSWTEPVRSAVGSAWGWVKEKLGIGGGDGESQGGLIQWIKEKASEAWEAVKEEAKPVIEPIMAVVEKVKAILPLDAIMELREKVRAWLEKVTTATASLDDEENLSENQDLLREKILPGVLKSISNLRDGIVGAGKWISSKMGLVCGAVTGFMDKLRANSLFSFAAGALAWLEEKAVQLAEWERDKVERLFTFIGDGLVWLSKFIEPVLNALKKVADVLGDLLGKLPDLILGPLWKKIPACIRKPIEDFIVNNILANIPVFGEIMKLPEVWGKLKETALRILKNIFVDGSLLKAGWTFFKAVLNAIGIPPQLVLSIIKNAASAMLDIITNPIGFFINLLRAVLKGFTQFFDNIWTHLLAGLGDWLFSQAGEAGIAPPTSLSFDAIFAFVLRVLGISMEKVFERLSKKVGPEITAKLRKALNILTGAWEWVSVLISEGPAGLWRLIKEKIDNLWGMIIKGVTGWLAAKVVEEAIVKVLSFLDPSGVMAVVNSLIAIYRAIQTVVEYINKLLEIVNTVLEAVVDIAKGAIDGAASFLEKALAGAIPVVIAFLANQVGLGRISKKIKEIVGAIQEKVEEAIDWLIDKAVTAGKAVLDGLKKVGGAVAQWWKRRETIHGGAETHTLYFKGDGDTAELIIESTPTSLEEYIKGIEKKQEFADSKKQDSIKAVKADLKEINKLKKQAVKAGTAPIDEKAAAEIDAVFTKILSNMQILVSGGEFGTEAHPIPLWWPKRDSAKYPTLYFGPKSNIRMAQNVLKADYDKPERSKLWKAKERVEKYEPHVRKALPDGGKEIGITSSWWIFVGKKFSVMEAFTSPGGKKINNELEKYGYSASDEGCDGDHVVERQFGGEDEIENLWPLDKGENRSSGATLKDMKFPSNGKEIAMPDLKKKFSKERPYWFVITRTKPA